MTDKPSIESALAHFGVKGMKWGHRKAQNSTSSTTPKNKANDKPVKKLYRKTDGSIDKVAVGASLFFLPAGLAYTYAKKHGADKVINSVSKVSVKEVKASEKQLKAGKKILKALGA